jgi:hypothetical protein
MLEGCTGWQVLQRTAVFEKKKKNKTKAAYHWRRVRDVSEDFGVFIYRFTQPKETWTA